MGETGEWEAGSRRKVWEWRDDQVVALRLAGQIVEEASNTRDQG